jgi:hypothetical protein
LIHAEQLKVSRRLNIFKKMAKSGEAIATKTFRPMLLSMGIQPGSYLRPGP